MTQRVPSRTPLYLAFARVAYKRNMQTMDRYMVLHEDPGSAHALDAVNTWQGDPWRRYVGRALVRDPEFYDKGGRPRAACGRQVLVALPAQYDAEDPDACPECAELVRTGKARGRFTQLDARKQDCGEFVRISHEGDLVIDECGMRWRHQGPHRGADGATWETGRDDVTPPPDGTV